MFIQTQPTPNPQRQVPPSTCTPEAQLWLSFCTRECHANLMRASGCCGSARCLLHLTHEDFISPASCSSRGSRSWKAAALTSRHPGVHSMCTPTEANVWKRIESEFASLELLSQRFLPAAFALDRIRGSDVAFSGTTAFWCFQGRHEVASRQEALCHRWCGNEYCQATHCADAHDTALAPWLTWRPSALKGRTTRNSMSDGYARTPALVSSQGLNQCSLVATSSQFARLRITSGLSSNQRCGGVSYDSMLSRASTLHQRSAHSSSRFKPVTVDRSTSCASHGAYRSSASLIHPRRDKLHGSFRSLCFLAPSPSPPAPQVFAAVMDFYASGEPVILEARPSAPPCPPPTFLCTFAPP